MPVAHIAWLGKKTPFCGNVTYGLSTTEALRKRGHQTSFIHFDNPGGPSSSNTSLLANDPDVSLPYLVKSQVYTIPSPRAQRELRECLKRLQPDVVHASLTLSPLDFRLPELCQPLGIPLVATFHPPFDAGNVGHWHRPEAESEVSSAPKAAPKEPQLRKGPQAPRALGSSQCCSLRRRQEPVAGSEQC